MPTKCWPRAIEEPENTLYKFEKALPVVYTENDLARVFAQDGAAVKRAEKLFARLDCAALTFLIDAWQALVEQVKAPS
ncbi:Scr1 family TA system antitoxin-like transcriptional regulator [Lentzea sp. NPDC006480]|uniref:Scr1 family TA system antitoxin-like transcriptional regulator n=1 Tax=Lentzea sp. NPDC006480 TaxID=3157176 RepID=UPI0033A47F85